MNLNLDVVVHVCVAFAICCACVSLCCNAVFDYFAALFSCCALCFFVLRFDACFKCVSLPFRAALGLPCSRAFWFVFGMLRFLICPSAFHSVFPLCNVFHLHFLLFSYLVTWTYLCYWMCNCNHGPKLILPCLDLMDVITNAESFCYEKNEWMVNGPTSIWSTKAHWHEMI